MLQLQQPWRSFRITFSLVLSIALAQSPASAVAIQFKPVSRELVQQRLGRYDGTDEKREATLKATFTESGCDEQHLSEQPVKGTKLPNVICVLPGETDKVIIVGAHFDHVSAGKGVVDNWSGASLLPSIYDSLKIGRRHHTFILIGFTAEEVGEIGSAFMHST